MAIPVLVVNNVGPVQAIKTSTSLLKQTWGEQIIGNIGFGVLSLIATLIILAVSVLLFILGFIGNNINLAFLIAAFVVFVLRFVILGIITCTLNSIYHAVLYKFAAKGANPFNFDEKLFKGTFKQKGNYFLEVFNSLKRGLVLL